MPVVRDTLGHALTRLNGTRTNIGLLTRRATYLVRMVDLSNKRRHGPSERPQPFGVALCALMPVVRDALGHASTRLNGHAHKYWPLVAYV
jgi:hypothetical protein